mgnify:CR=1 FL=1
MNLIKKYFDSFTKTEVEVWKLSNGLILEVETDLEEGIKSMYILYNERNITEAIFSELNKNNFRRDEIGRAHV